MTATETTLSTEQIAAMLTANVAAIRALVLGLPDDARRRSPAPGEWSPLTVAGHLVTIDTVGNQERLRLILSENDPVFPGIDVNGIARERADDTKDAMALLDELARTRAESVTQIMALQPADLTRTGLHPAAGKINGQVLLQRWVAHDLEHLAQISAAARAWVLSQSATNG